VVELHPAWRWFVGGKIGPNYERPKKKYSIEFRLLGDSTNLPPVAFFARLKLEVRMDCMKKVVCDLIVVCYFPEQKVKISIAVQGFTKIWSLGKREIVQS
jgi:hypothetical protein